MPAKIDPPKSASELAKEKDRVISTWNIRVKPKRLESMEEYKQRIIGNWLAKRRM